MGFLHLVVKPFVSFLVLQSPREEERAACFTLIAFLLLFVSFGISSSDTVPWIGL